MLGLVEAASSVLGTLGGGGSPLGSAVGQPPDGPQTSQATTTTTAAQTTGAFSVGGGSGLPAWLPWLIGGLALAYLAKKARIL